MKLVQGKQFNILFFLLWLIIVAVIWVVLRQDSIKKQVNTTINSAL